MELVCQDRIHDVIKENLPIGFLVVDRDGIIVDFNGAAQTITGFQKNEVLGKSHCQMLHDGSTGEDSPLIQETLRNHRDLVETETTMRKKNGELITISLTSFPLKDDKGSFFGGVKLFRDITSRKKLERERKNILSMFAHDMKNPITASVGIISRILSQKAGKINQKQVKYLKVVSENLDKILHLVNDFLEFSHLENKKYIPEKVNYTMISAIKNIIEPFKIEAEKKNIQVIFQYSENFPYRLNADAKMIDRVVTNLLGNALQYSKPDGTITVKLVEEMNNIVVQVIDTGIGIPTAELAYIFDPFFRISKDSSGSGLGLVIAKTIIEAHGGRVFAESSYGDGSVFSFSLPK